MKRVTRLVAWMLIAFLIAGNLQAPVFAAAADEGVPEQDVIEAEVLEEPSEGAAGPEELLPEAETAFSEAEDPASDDEAIDAGPDESVQETEASDTEDEEAVPEEGVSEDASVEDASAGDTFAGDAPAEDASGKALEDPQEEAPDQESSGEDVSAQEDFSVQEEELAEEPLKEEVSEERMLAAEDHENDFGSAVEIGVGESVQGSVTEDNPYAFFRFTPEEDGTYQIYTVSEYDSYGFLFEEDPEGEGSFSQLEADDDNGEGSNFMITGHLTGGRTYWVRVNQYSYGSMEFAISVERRSLIVNGAQEQAFNVLEGEEVTFSVDAQSETEITYTWYERPADSDEKNELENESGASLTVTAEFTDQDTMRFFYCRIESGGEEVWRLFTLQKITLRAWFEGYDWNQDSIWLNVKEGESATFTAAAETADGSSPSFEWYQYQGEGDKVILGTEASYTTDAITESQSYICKVAAEDGTEVSLSVFVEVDSSQEPSELYVWPEGNPYESWQEVDILGCDSVTLSVYAENSLGHEVRYQWFKESREDQNSYFEDEWTEIADATEKDYVVEAPTCLDRFRCVVTDTDQNEGCVDFELRAENGFYITRDFNKDGYIIGNIQDVRGLDSITIHLETYAEDLDGITYQWYRQDGEDAVELEGETGDSLTVQDPQNGTAYFCNARDKYGYSSTLWCYFRQNNNLEVYAGYENDNWVYDLTIDPRNEETYTLTPHVEADDMEGLRYSWSMWDGNDTYDGIGEEESLYIDHQPQGNTTYYCEVTDRFGNSGTARYYFLEDIGLEVYPEGASADHPSASYLVAGMDKITLTAVVHVEEGKSVSYYWRADSSKERILDEEQGTIRGSGELTLKLSLPEGGETFYCEVSDGHGNSKTAEFHFEEIAPLMAARPDGAEEGEDTAIVEFDPDEPTWFSMRAIYEGEEDENNILYTWKDGNGEEMRSGYGYNYYGEGKDDYEDGERISCTLTDSFGQTATVYFVISVKTKIAAAPEQTFFRNWGAYGGDCESGDARISYTPGQEITLKTVAETRPAGEITYAWYASEEEDPEDWGEPIAGETNRILKVQDPHKNYRCVATAVGKDVSAHATFYLEAENHLFVYPEGNRRKDDTAEIYAEAGKPVTLKAIVEADDSTGLTYKWFRETVTEEGVSDYDVQVDGASDSLVTGPVTEQTGYCCRVEDQYGNSGSAYFKINLNKLDVYPVGRTTSSRFREIEAALGGTVTLKAKVVTSDPGTVVTWKYRDLESESGIPVTGTFDSASSTAELVLDQISKTGTYECQVKDSYGNEESAYFGVLVNHFRAWPANDPDSSAVDVRAAAGSDVTLRIGTEGDDLSKVTYTWEKVEEIWDSDTWEYRENVQTVGSDRDLILQGVTDTATYRCRVSDGYGNNKEISFYLNVNAIVVEKEGPSSFSIRPGESVTMKVKAEGGPDAGDLTYRWETDGNTLYGKTSDTLTITPEKSGFYCCYVRDGSGNEASADFNVEVNHLRAWPKEQEEGLYYDFRPVEEGSIVRLETAWDADDKDVSFRWEDDDGEIEGAVSDSLTTEPVTEDHYYTCTVSDKYGNKEEVRFSVYITGKDFAVRPEGCEEGENETIVDAEDGKPVSLKVVLENAKEGENYTYRWIDATDGRRKIINGAASDTLVISKARANERYICQATNKEGYSENTPEAVFNIRTNHFRAVNAVGEKDGSWADAWKVLAYPGEMATLKVDVTADDTSALTYKWLDDGDVQEEIFSDTPGSCRVRAPKEEEHWGEPFFYTYYCYISDQYGNEEKITFHVYADKNAPVLKEIKEGDVVLAPASGTGLVYDGKAKEPEVTVTVDEKVLEAGTDYEVSYSGNVNAGENTAKVTVTGKGDYEGVVEKTFSIAKAGQNLKADDLAVNVFSSGRIGLTGAEGSVSYTSSTPAIASVDADGTVTGKKAGTAKITVQAKETENYLPAETELTVTVNRIRLAAGDVTVDPAPLTYNGKKQTPAVTVKKGSRKLAADKDYTIVYADNLNAGTAKVTVTGKGNYRGAVEKTFSIAKADQKLTVKAAKALISVGQTTTVSVSGAKGTKTFKSNSSAATVNSKGEVTANKVATVKITVSAAAKPNFNPASASVTIKIAPGATKKLTAANQAKGIKITWQKVAGANSYIIYRNNNKVKTISGGTTVSWADTKADTDGVKYTYKVVANASTGTSSLSRSVAIFRVSAPAIKSLKNTASKKATVTWGKKPKATGYEIQYSLKKNFSGAKTAKITSMTTVSKVIGNLAKGKIWYFRIRAVKKVDSTTYRSVWSSVKSIKITK